LFIYVSLVGYGAIIAHESMTLFLFPGKC